MKRTKRDNISFRRPPGGALRRRPTSELSKYCLVLTTSAWMRPTAQMRVMGVVVRVDAGDFLTFIAGLSLVCFAHAQEPGSSSSPSSPPPVRGTPSAAAASSANTKTNPQVVLRAETRLVQLNVIAQDKKGQPIEGLKREDFTLLDNGKPQNITLFSSEPETLSRQKTQPAMPISQRGPPTQKLIRRQMSSATAFGTPTKSPAASL